MVNPWKPRLIYHRHPSVTGPGTRHFQDTAGRLLSLWGPPSQLAMAFSTGLILTSNL